MAFWFQFPLYCEKSGQKVSGRAVVFMDNLPLRASFVFLASPSHLFLFNAYYPSFTSSMSPRLIQIRVNQLRNYQTN